MKRKIIIAMLLVLLFFSLAIYMNSRNTMELAPNSDMTSPPLETAMLNHTSDKRENNYSAHNGKWIAYNQDNIAVVHLKVKEDVVTGVLSSHDKNYEDMTFMGRIQEGTIEGIFSSKVDGQSSLFKIEEKNGFLVLNINHTSNKEKSISEGNYLLLKDSTNM